MPDGASDTETAILDAALAEVLAHGIRRTTASDIARRCGIARQTLYRYWPDAQSIFAALVTRELVAALPAGAAEPQDLDALVELLVETADRIRRMPLVERLRDTAARRAMSDAVVRRIPWARTSASAASRIAVRVSAAASAM